MWPLDNCKQSSRVHFHLHQASFRKYFSTLILDGEPLNPALAKKGTPGFFPVIASPQASFLRAPFSFPLLNGTDQTFYGDGIYKPSLPVTFPTPPPFFCRHQLGGWSPLPLESRHSEPIGRLLHLVSASSKLTGLQPCLQRSSSDEPMINLVLQSEFWSNLWNCMLLTHMVLLFL